LLIDDKYEQKFAKSIYAFINYNISNAKFDASSKNPFPKSLEKLPSF